MPILINVNELLEYLEEEADKRMISNDVVEEYDIEGLELCAFCTRCGSYALRAVIEDIRNKEEGSDFLLCLH